MFHQLRPFLVRHPYLPLPLLLAVTVLTFLPTFTNGFQMEWDDQWMVMNPLTTCPFGWDLVLMTFATPFNGQWAPLNQFMYTLIYSVWGYDPSAFHAASLLFHLANVVLVYSFLYRLLRDCMRLGSVRILQVTVLSTLLFAVHPLQVETVAWISASKILMSTTFYLLAAYSLALYLRGNRRRYYAGTLLLFFLSYLSKEQSVTFPLFATLLCVWYGGRFSDSGLYRKLAPIYLLSLLFCLHEIFLVSNYNLYVQSYTYSWWQRVAFCFYSLSAYVMKWIFPFDLNWLYLYPSGIDDSLPLWLLPYPILMVYLLCTSWRWVCKPHVASSLSFFVIHLLLVLHILVLPRSAIVADRYMYVSILGLNFLLAYYLSAGRFVSRSPRLSVFVACVLVVACCVVSYHRTRAWSDSQTLKECAVPSRPHHAPDTLSVIWSDT